MTCLCCKRELSSSFSRSSSAAQLLRVNSLRDNAHRIKASSHWRSNHPQIYPCNPIAKSRIQKQKKRTRNYNEKLVIFSLCSSGVRRWLKACSKLSQARSSGHSNLLPNQQVWVRNNRASSPATSTKLTCNSRKRIKQTRNWIYRKLKAPSGS